MTDRQTFGGIAGSSSWMKTCHTAITGWEVWVIWGKANTGTAVSRYNWAKLIYIWEMFESFLSNIWYIFEKCLRGRKCEPLEQGKQVDKYLRTLDENMMSNICNNNKNKISRNIWARQTLNSIAIALYSCAKWKCQQVEKYLNRLQICFWLTTDLGGNWPQNYFCETSLNSKYRRIPRILALPWCDGKGTSK